MISNFISGNIFKPHNLCCYVNNHLSSFIFNIDSTNNIVEKLPFNIFPYNVVIIMNTQFRLIKLKNTLVNNILFLILGIKHRQFSEIDN